MIADPHHSFAPAPLAPGQWTWESFLAIEDEDDTRELVNGHLMELEMPTEEHEFAIAALIIALGVWADAHGGRVYGSGYKVRIAAKRGAMPDVQFSRRGRKPPSKGLSEGAPDLAVEVVSPSSGRFDRVMKLEWYRSIAVPEYWLVDPFERSLTRYVLRADGHYSVTHALTDDASFEPSDTFPGLVIPLTKLWSPAAAEDAAP